MSDNGTTTAALRPPVTREPTVTFRAGKTTVEVNLVTRRAFFTGDVCELEKLYDLRVCIECAIEELERTKPTGEEAAK